MNEWIENGWMDEWIENGWMYEWMDEWGMDGWGMDGCINKCMGGSIYQRQQKVVGNIVKRLSRRLHNLIEDISWI